MDISPTNRIEVLHGVGENTAKKFHRLGIQNIKDLLFHFPSRYEDTSKIKNITDLEATDELQTVQGKIISIKNIFTRNRKKLTTAKVADTTGGIEVLWFNQHFLTKILKLGTIVLLSGKYDAKTKKLISPKYEPISEYREPTHLARITPIYPETKGLTSKFLRKIIKDLFTYTNIEKIAKEKLPKRILDENDLISLPEAMQFLHFPEKFDEVEKGKDRIAFGEIYNILKKVERQKQKQSKYKAEPILTNQKLVNDFLNNLTFKPTNAQIRCIDEVLEDIASERPMNRLLEGDVGSGKTLVAATAALNTLSNEFQTAILVPTQVLAEQHYKTFMSFLPWLEDEIALVTRNKKLDASFKKKIVIGTHAILHQAYNLFDNLGLVVIDEQHRFGVKQREFLSEFVKNIGEKNKILPHVLSMTATPIPRSLILTLYGNLELSIIDEMPEGRIPVETHVVPNAKRKASYEWIRKEVKKGGQVFVICPLVEESDKLQVKSVKEEYKRLSEKVFPELKVTLLHGKVKPAEKEKILIDFKNKKTDILVSTSVIEVGIDIPNATVMVIEDAERFGLAQLHQFRGRVGRSNKKSYCLLFTDNGQALNRLQFFASTNEGLKIAEFDLKSRGPGEVYGTKQSGIPNLKFASLMDLDLIKRVKKSL